MLTKSQIDALLVRLPPPVDVQKVAQASAANDALRAELEAQRISAPNDIKPPPIGQAIDKVLP